MGEKESRPEEPVLEEDPGGPVVVKKIDRQSRSTLFLLAWSTAMYCWFVAVIVVSVLDPGGPLLTPVILGLLLLVTSPIMASYFKALYSDLLEENLLLEEDRLRKMKGEKVLMEIPFAGGTTVEVFYKDEGKVDQVRGYSFKERWWWEVTQVTDSFYSPEDVARMWPVVEAAVRKHGMQMGENIRKLINGEDG